MSGIQISILDTTGLHNARDKAQELSQAKEYQDLSTVIVVATRGMIPAKAYQAHNAMMKPMNQMVTTLCVINAEVASAYEEAVNVILTHPSYQDKTWKYMLTMEEDNIPPPDGLLKLYESMNKGYSVVGGLYYTKGEEGRPMAFGDPNVLPRNYAPIYPPKDTLTEVNGLAMGFTLFDLDIFRDKNFPRPWFKTQNELTPEGWALRTQDLWFCTQAAKLGHRFAIDSRVMVGHYDVKNDIVW